MNKIKISITALLVMLSIGAAVAQAAVSLGVKGGLNFANVNADSPGTAFASRTGYHLGAFLSAKFAKLAIQPEIVYSQQGMNFTINGGSSVDQNFSYVNIPIILKLYLVGGLNLQAGPQFGFLTSAARGGVDVKSLYKSSDFSVALGAGLDISNITIDARYNMGISEINDEAGSDAVKNQVFQLSLGFKLFNFGS